MSVTEEEFISVAVAEVPPFYFTIFPLISVQLWELNMQKQDACQSHAIQQMAKMDWLCFFYTWYPIKNVLVEIFESEMIRK